MKPRIGLCSTAYQVLVLRIWQIGTKQTRAELP